MALAYTSSVDVTSFISNIGGAHIVVPSYTSSIDTLYFASDNGGIHLIVASYTSSADTTYFTSDVGGRFNLQNNAYTSSIDFQNFTSNIGGLHIPPAYRDDNLLSSLVGTKNQTYVYVQTIDTGSFLSSNLTGIKNTQALPVYVYFGSAFPYARLNISRTAPFLKQVFVE